MRGKIRRPSGDWAMPRSHDQVRRHLRDVVAVVQDLARARPGVAADRHHQRRFAGAVGADQRDDLARIDLQVDASSA